MNLARYINLEIRRMLKDRSPLFFSIVLPVLLYLVLDSTNVTSDQPIGDGNILAYSMIGMAIYGGITGAVSSVGGIVLDETSGWQRQLALTPLRTWQRLVTHVAVTSLRICLPVAAVFMCGWVSGASLPAATWVITAALTVAACVPFSLYGLAFGTAFRSHGAVSIATGCIVPLSFLGNSFAPLSETILSIGRFSPLYGSTALARFPLTHGFQALSDAPFSVTDPLWYALANIAGWTLVFAGVNVLLWRRDHGRLA
ncbi:ABC transporter permease [Corynebacterium sp.]|uniref:ABC transporter permease n=1 Tax=Corynebacterium sp. TaxID=1720 RepID=UPI0026DD76A5|nr:ABC transporter permease [Corynebacterium sp.]MDO5076988.1 ABC transporter permease [Corynebacterium sp.]